MTYRATGDFADFYRRMGDHSTKGTCTGGTDYLPVRPEPIDWAEWAVRGLAQDRLNEEAKAILRAAVFRRAKQPPAIVHPEGREIPKTPSEVIAEMRRWRHQKVVA